jgi:carbonic anhydrase
MTSDSYSKLVAGVLQFQRDIHGPNEAHFRKLAEGQSPDALLITCADSRVDPYLITQSKPGDIFVCRSVGNLVPPHGSSDLGTAALIEYSVKVLKVGHLIVCGHSCCGAVRSLLDLHDDADVPRVTAWLHFAESALHLTRALVKDGNQAERLRRAAELNVIAQLTNARTYPEIATAVALGKLTLHGWYYDIAAGEITALDPATNEFVPISAAS